MGFFLIGVMQINTFMMFVFAGYLLFISKGNMLLNKLLGFIFLSRMLSNVFLLVYLGPWLALMSKPLIVIPVLSMLASPCVYFYVRSYLSDDTKLYKSDWLHVLPFLAALINVLPAIFSSVDLTPVFFDSLLKETNNNKITLFLPIRFQIAIKSFLMIAYCGYSFYILLKKTHRKRSPLFKSAKYWLLSFLCMILVLNVLASSLTWGIAFNASTQHSLLENDLLMGSFLVLMIGYMLYPVWQPVVLYGNIQPEVVVINNSSANSEETVEKDVNNFSFSLPDDQILQYKQHLTILMLQEKLYLNPELTVSLLASKLNIPLHHLSYLLNQVIKQSFRDYINQFRIAHFLREYGANVQQFTLESMSQQVGFKTYRTFLNAFKKETGNTPAAYFQKVNA